jgi:virulence factor Mce-like protein
MKNGVIGNAVIIGAFAALSVGGMEFLALNMGQPSPFSSAYTLHAQFADADGVATSADVRVAGVDVGKVTGVGHDPAQPGVTQVTMTITDAQAVPVYSNGTVTVRPKTLLGEKYLDLTLGSAAGEAIPTGGFLPASQASKDVSSDEIFNSMDAATRANLQQVLAALNTATQQRSGDIRAILPNLQTAVSDLVPVAQVYSNDQSQVDSILLNLNTILQTTADENQQIASLLANGNVALSAIASRDNSLVTTLARAGNVASEINTAAAPTVSAQQQALGELGPTLASTNTLLNEVIGPQAACGGRSCGIAELFAGTLTGNLNYPNDQLTVTSPSGNQVTNEWASMFSQPATASSDGGATHSALNLVISIHCDAAAQTLSEVLNGLPVATQNQIQQVCQAANGHASSFAPAALVNEAALLMEGAA